MSACAIMTIDYDEDDPTSYRAVAIRRTDKGGGDPQRFATGDPVADFRAACLAGRTLAAQGVDLMLSSSCGHFVHDVPGYRYVIDPDLGEILARDA